MHTILSYLLLFFTLKVASYGQVQASNILFFHLAATSSHRTSIWPLAEKLADNGHSVTYIFPILEKIGSHLNVTEITPSKMVPLAKDFGGNLDINMKLNNTLHKFYERAFDASLDLCEAFYDSPEIKDWLKTPNLHFDLLMIDSAFSECAYGLVHKFKSKHIIFAPAIAPFNWDGFGVVPESASIPPLLSMGGPPPKVREMGLVGRIKATVEPILWRLGFQYLCVPKMKAIIEDRLNMTGLPDLQDFETNASLVMVNLHTVEEFPLALPPYFVSYSGLWCSRDQVKSRKPLPDDLAQFVEHKDSKGFVYVSFGSSVIASAMPLELRDTFFEAFKSFPKIKFLWKWTGEVPADKPGNVWMQRWFPQHDILAHPKIKGFVTQCGRPSTQEALCHGVPLITIPIFGDQDYNADRMEQVGAAINIDIRSMTTNTLKEAMTNLIYSDKYKNKMLELSQIFKDRPIDPLDNVVYWTEYVLRHKDTSLMKPLGMKLTWYQRRLLDVYAVIAGALLTIIAILLSTTYFIAKKLRRFFSFFCISETNKNK